MNAKMVSDAMSEVDGKYIDEALFYNAKASHPRRFHRLPAALIAAILALLLMGTGVAVSMIYGDSIQSWFSHYWEEITGQAMSEDHIAVIESLSQEIGASQTVGDVTITVDSATVGDGRFDLLVKIEGIDISDKTHGYCFLTTTMKITPEPSVINTGIQWIKNYSEENGDGETFLLMPCEYVVDDSTFGQDTPPLQVCLSFQDLARDPYTDKETIIAAGEWEFSFEIDRSQPIEIISLPDIEVKAMEIGPLGHAETTVTIKNIELTSMGLHFQYHSQNGTLFLQEKVITAILKDGSIVGEGCLYDRWEGDKSSLYRWRVPINLNEVAAIQFGETQIAIP